MARVLFTAVLLLLLPSNSLAAEKNEIRFGITAVVVRENLRFFDELADYLRQSLDRPVRFVRRKTYREIMDLLKNGNLDFAWICGYPFVQKRDPDFLSLIASPIYKGKPYYRSLIIVNKHSQHKDLADLRGKVFAFSDPDSNSGYIYPRFFITQRKFNPDNYFRQTFFTYNHAETVQAVAVRFADGGAVESYIWEYLKKTNQNITEQTRVIHSSPLFGFPPIVAHRNVSPTQQKKMRQALIFMNKHKVGQSLLDKLNLDGFRPVSPGLYDDIRVMAERLENGDAHTKLRPPGQSTKSR